MTYIQPNPNGSATSANSSPVVIASDQATVPVSLASVPSHAVTNAGTFATQATLAAETTKVIGTVNVASGQAITANAGTNLNTSALALDATLTGGTQKTIARGGAKGSTTAADVTSVSVDANTQALHTSITNFPATQPVSIASMPSTPVTGTFWQATQPVSGTVTANAGTGTMAVSAASLPLPTGAAADATLTGRTQKTQLTDGTRDGTVKAASTLPVLTDTAVVTTQRDPLPAGTNVIGHVIADSGSTTAVTSLPAIPAGTNVIGHVIADTGSTTAVTGNVTVVQPTGTNLHAVIDTGSTTAVTQSTAANLNAQVVGAAASGATKAGNPIQVGGVFNTTQPTVTTGQAVELQATARGAQLVATGVDTFNATINAALPTGANTIGAVTGPSAAPLALDATLTGGTQKSKLVDTGGTNVASVSAAGALKVDNSAVTQPVSGNVSIAASSSNGFSKTKYAAQTTTVQTVKGTAGTLAGYIVYNPNTSVIYVQIFDVATATTVTLGTTVPDILIPVPAGATANLLSETGVAMALGIKLAVTTTATGLTAPVTGSDMTIFYK